MAIAMECEDRTPEQVPPVYGQRLRAIDGLAVRVGPASEES